MIDSAHNPYSAPLALPDATRTDDTASDIRWGRWMAGAVSAETVVTVAVLAADTDGQAGMPSGVVCAVLSGIGLAAACLLAGRYFPLKSSLLLSQGLNAAVWLTMLITVYLVLPALEGQSLTLDDLEIFGMIWLGGAVASPVFVLLAWLTRNALRDRGPAAAAGTVAETGRKESKHA
ncbi:MAG: hypothetical protein RIK87_22205 [Fuerstiella sp.]